MVRLNPPQEQKLETKPFHNSVLLTDIISFIKVMKMTARRTKGMRMMDKIKNINPMSISGLSGICQSQSQKKIIEPSFTANKK